MGAAVAATGGALLIASMFLVWYEITGAGVLDSITEAIDETTGTQFSDATRRTGWEAFELTDLLCTLAGVVALVRGVIAYVGPDDNPPIPGAMLVTALGAAAIVAILYRLINPPGVGFQREIGVFIGLIGAAAITYGSAIALRDRPRV